MPAEAAQHRVRLRRLLIPGLVSLLFFALGIGLGVWQVERLHWKRGVLDRIAAAEAAPGIALPDAPKPFEKVAVVATAIPGAVGRYASETRETAQGTVLGSQMIYAERLAEGGPPLLVMAGWVPDAAAPPAPPSGRLEGYVRPASHPGLFSATDDPAARRFFTLDPAVIGPALGVGAVRPYVLVLLGHDVPGVYPQPAQGLPRPPNDHLQYAITWFALAAVVLVIFAVYARGTLGSGQA